MRSLVRTPLGILGLYLCVTFPLLLVGILRGGDAGGWALVVVHGLAAGGAMWRAVRGPADAWWTLALPLLVIPAAYAEVPWLNQALAPGFHDPLVLAWERAFTGSDPSRQLAGLLPWRWVSEPLHLAYASFYPGLYLPPLLLALRGRREDFATNTLGILLAGTLCYLTFTLFPVQGPRYFGAPMGVPDGPIRSMVLLILERGSSRGAAFPSAHMALMTVQSVLSLRFQPKVGAVVAVATVGVGFGAVYGGFHYAVDIAAGTLVGAASAAVALWLRRGLDRSV